MAQDNRSEKKTNRLVWSYLGVRRAVGRLGILLPVMLFAFGMMPGIEFMPSISEFYYTPVREALVATIGAISVFLFSYKGYSIHPKRAQNSWAERNLTDRRVSFAAAAGALGVAVFPTSSDVWLEPLPVMVSWLGPCTSALLHNLSALTFFVALAVFCLVNFQRTDPEEPVSPEREDENAFYRGCGYVLAVATVVLIAISIVNITGNWPDLAAMLAGIKAIFWVETIGLFAFAASWLVKGETLTPAVGMMRMMRR